MLFIRYPYVRWLIAFLILIWVGIWIGLRPQGPALIGVILALVVTVLAWINPPGVYSWLITPTCPQCGGRLHWSVIQPEEHDPYLEEIRVACTRCGWGRVEFRNAVGPLSAGPTYRMRHEEETAGDPLGGGACSSCSQLVLHPFEDRGWCGPTAPPPGSPLPMVQRAMGRGGKFFRAGPKAPPPSPKNAQRLSCAPWRADGDFPTRA